MRTNIVASEFAERCEVQLAYSNGVAEPVSVSVNTFGTGKLSDEELVNVIIKVFDFRPQDIIYSLGLKKAIYSNLAAYGHFGRHGYPWEKIDKIDKLKERFGMEAVNHG